MYELSDPRKSNRVPSYTYYEVQEGVPDFSMLTFPVTVRSIDKFERTNNISMDVYAIDEKYPKKQGNGMQLVKRRRRNEFIDDEASCEGDEGSDIEEDGNISDIIDDDVNDDDLSIYRVSNNQMK